MQAVILAGGLGTRLGDLTRDVPKPMVLVHGRPFLEYEIELLRENGVEQLVLCVGYRGRAVEAHFGDGRGYGVKILYSHDGPRLLGPAGALKRASPYLADSFLVTYGDAYLRMDYGRLMSHLSESRALGVMAVYRNYNRHGRSDLVVKGGRIVRYDKKGDGKEMTWINFGVSALRKKALELIPPKVPCGEEEFYGELIARGELLAHTVRRRFYEVGTQAALQEFERFILRAGGARGL